MKRKTGVILMVVIAGILWGCYPEGHDYYSDYDLVYTNYDKEYSFTGHGNYTIPEQIVKITGDVLDGEAPQFVNSVYATPMLARIKTNMAALGYTYVADTTSADLVLFPSALEVTNISYYWDYWWYYWDWWYYWGWYYPYPITYSYKTGSLFMNLVDIKNPTPAGDRRVIWTGVINGLLEGSTTDFLNRMEKSIDQAFTQSDYLHQ
jgi:hypothetical protein